MYESTAIEYTMPTNEVTHSVVMFNGVTTPEWVIQLRSG